MNILKWFKEKNFLERHIETFPIAGMVSYNGKIWWVRENIGRQQFEDRYYSVPRLVLSHHNTETGEHIFEEVKNINSVIPLSDI